MEFTRKQWKHQETQPWLVARVYRFISNKLRQDRKSGQTKIAYNVGWYPQNSIICYQNSHLLSINWMVITPGLKLNQMHHLNKKKTAKFRFQLEILAYPWGYSWKSWALKLKKETRRNEFQRLYSQRCHPSPKLGLRGKPVACWANQQPWDSPWPLSIPCTKSIHL